MRRAAQNASGFPGGHVVVDIWHLIRAAYLPRTVQFVPLNNRCEARVAPAFDTFRHTIRTKAALSF